MIASGKGYLELVNEILIKDAWVNHCDGDQRSALHYAIDNQVENLDVVNLLIENQADINKETMNDGFTPLIIAVNRGHKSIAKRLIDQGAKIDAFECCHSNTALHIACMNGEFDIVQMLANIETFETLCKKENKDG
jgi:ankyrin repeat protein